MQGEKEMKGMVSTPTDILTDIQTDQAEAKYAMSMKLEYFCVP